MTIWMDLAGLALLVILLVYIGILQKKVSAFRGSLKDASQAIPALDAAVERMNDAATGFSERIRGEMEAVDGRVAGVRRMAAELTNASREAEEILTRLEQYQRKARQIESARASAPLPAHAEPKGLDRMARSPASRLAPDLEFAPPPTMITPAIAERPPAPRSGMEALIRQPSDFPSSDVARRLRVPQS